ncbi:MAG: lipoyl domain-containing protein [Candidatus Limnocylindrales bacterium]
MARVPVTMPKLGYATDVGRIGAWVRQVGDYVARGDILAEIETDKTTVEMEALTTGTLVEILHWSGEDISAGDVIAFVDDGG